MGHRRQLAGRSIEELRGHRTAVLIFTSALVIAIAYLALEVLPLVKGNQGELRGVLISLFAVILALCLLSTRPRLIIPVTSLIVFVSLLGLVALLLRSPGAYAFGLVPGNPGDFDINSSGALELYHYGHPPYAIEEKYHLVQPSLSFPFPTYAIYWLCSGFGLWGRAIAGLNFTVLNAVAAFVLIGVSYRLSSADLRTLSGPKRRVAILVGLFLALTSPFWLEVLTGNTAVLAACLMILGLWYARKRFARPGVIPGACLALGAMIKPNFAALLLYFPTARFRSLAQPRNVRARGGYMRVFLLTVICAISFIAASLVFPRGMHLDTYTAWLTQAGPVLQDEARWSRINISLLGLFNALSPRPVPPVVASVVLIGATIAFGLRYGRSSWMIWLVIPLLVSPITWTSYMGLALPAQFAIVYHCVKRERFVDLALLAASISLLWAPRTVTFLGAIALVVLLYLVLKLDPDEFVPEVAVRLVPS